jgi:EAL domain-containing protein (putative c-di-GMP-specific phosphodiesterase class I)
MPGMDSFGTIGALLRAVREHLGMDIAFICQVIEGDRIFQCVDGADGWRPITPGASGPVAGSYCQHIIDGTLPGVIPDTAQNALAVSLPVTAQMQIGAYLATPIHLRNGEVFGTYCCANRRAKSSLDERDLQMLKVFADVTARQIDGWADERREHQAKTVRILERLDLNPAWVMFQPIFDLRDNRLAGVEALARFPGPPEQTPDRWFAEAEMLGLAPQFELAAVKRALLALPTLPADISLTLNVSPASLMSGEIIEALSRENLERLVVEVTEHQPIHDYEAFAAAIDPLRQRGLRVAVDDAGAGYATFRHILQLRPDIIKLDNSLTRGIDADSKKRALAGAIIEFGAATNMLIVAEGVETEAELACARSIGAHKAQGYLLGRPMPMDKLIQLRARQFIN